MLFNLIILLIILFLLFMLSMVWPPDSPWAPWWRTSKKTARIMCKLAKVNSKDLIIDLGSGDGTALITAAKEFGTRGIGVEIDPFRYFISNLLLRINLSNSKVKFIRGNFFDQNLSKADVIFVYLVPKTLEKLLPKFKKELKKGTRVISYRYEMKLKLKEYDAKNGIRLYII
jgi:predicted nicotinamide N-methyase